MAFAAGFSSSDPVGRDYGQSDLVLLVVYVLMALVLSFACSVAEAVLLSITPSFIAQTHKETPKLGKLLLKLKEDNVDQSLAAILTLNTIAHTVGAIGSGAKATAVFGSAWFGVFSAVMTFLILFLSEIIPKTLGAVHWRRLVGITAQFVRALIFLLYPLIWLSEKLTKLIAKNKSVHPFSREEFIAMAGIGEKTGHIDQSETRVIKNLFRLRQLQAGDILTPGTVLYTLQEDKTVEEVIAQTPKLPFSRIPIYSDTKDSINGFVLKFDIAECLVNQKSGTRLKDLKRDLFAIPKQMPLDELLEFLLKEKRHIALVVDEFGTTSGVVTLEDVVETLLGTEIVDEVDTIEDLQAHARELWRQRTAKMGLDTNSPESG
jgi:CBS domain containing-hemolysin-like protein